MRPTTSRGYHTRGSELISPHRRGDSCETLTSLTIERWTSPHKAICKGILRLNSCSDEACDRFLRIGARTFARRFSLEYTPPLFSPTAVRSSSLPLSRTSYAYFIQWQYPVQCFQMNTSNRDPCDSAAAQVLFV
jgi:hypothetical protein